MGLVFGFANVISPQRRRDAEENAEKKFRELSFALGELWVARVRADDDPGMRIRDAEKNVRASLGGTGQEACPTRRVLCVFLCVSASLRGKNSFELSLICASLLCISLIALPFPRCRFAR